MCHEHRRGHGRRGFRRFGNRAEWLQRLEHYQRDLEQELADVADVIKRLRDGEPKSAETVNL